MGTVRTYGDGIWFCRCEVRSSSRTFSHLEPIRRRYAPLRLAIEHTRGCVGRSGRSRDTGRIVESSVVRTCSSIRRHSAVGRAMAYLVPIGSPCLCRLPSGGISGIRVILGSRVGRKTGTVCIACNSAPTVAYRFEVKSRQKRCKISNCLENPVCCASATRRRTCFGSDGIDKLRVNCLVGQGRQTQGKDRTLVDLACNRNRSAVGFCDLLDDGEP